MSIDRGAELVTLAREARGSAYAPYSHYQVGAAALGDNDAVAVGVNVENASYGLTACAERVAMWSAVAAGARRVVALALVTADAAAPCGACRQVMHELMGPSDTVLLAGPDGRWRVATVAELLPEAFG